MAWRKPLSSEVLCEIIRLRQEEHLSAAAIARRLGISPSSCSRHLIPVFGRTRGTGTDKMRATVDVTRFAEMNTEEEAYWLGFFFTDGCITDKGMLSVALSAKDAPHLNKLATFLNASRPPRPAKGKVYKGGRNPIVIFTAQSIRLSGNLRRAGLHPRKTWTVKPWAGPAHLLRHFWRGCVDGDGGFYLRRNRRRGGGTTQSWGMTFCGNEAMVFGFAAFMTSSINVTCKPQAESTSPTGLTHWGVRYFGLTAAAAAEALYRDATISLDRKVVIAEMLIAQLEAKRAEPKNVTCSTPSCGRKFWAKGLCDTCYSRVRRSRVSRDTEYM